MNKNNKIFSTYLSGLLALGVSVASTTFAEGDRLYRYKGVSGEVVIDDHIPQEFVSNGYTILTKGGMVVERIAPALTDKQRANLSVADREKEEREEQAKKDKWLLERYSDAGDAVLGRDRQLGAIETLIVVAQSNINKLKQEEHKELEFAAADERRGIEVSEEVLERLDSIRSQIRSAEQQIENQKEEKIRVTQKFEGIILRLQDIEERRKGR